MSIVAGTVDLTLDFDHPVETVFAAWSREEAQRRWGDPGAGWTMAFDQFRFAVGEVDICRFGPAGGTQYLNENRYLAILPRERIVYATSLVAEGRLTFAGTVAVSLAQTDMGTRLQLVEHGLYFDGEDDVASHRAGWESMLGALGRYLDAKA